MTQGVIIVQSVPRPTNQESVSRQGSSVRIWQDEPSLDSPRPLIPPKTGNRLTALYDLTRSYFGLWIDPQFRTQDFECRALLVHVVMPVVVPRLHARQSMRLQMTPNFAADTTGCKERLDARANPL